MTTDTDRANRRWARDRDAAREARTDEFEAISGLRRSTGFRKLFPKGSIDFAPPALDHYAQFFDPVTGCSILVDCPHPGRREPEEMAAWEKLHNWSARKVDWGSTWGNGTELWLMAPNGRGLDLENIVLRFNGAPPATPDPTPPSSTVVIENATYWESLGPQIHGSPLVRHIARNASLSASPPRQP